MKGATSTDSGQPRRDDEPTWSSGASPDRTIAWVYRAVVGLLGAAALIFIGTNMQFFLNGDTEGAVGSYYTVLPMASALVIGIVVVFGTSYVVQTVRREAALALEVERLRSKAKVADSLRELRHDFDNQLTVVLALLQMGNTERAVDYLRGIMGRDVVEAAEEGYEAFFGFLAHKAVEAQRRGVRIDTQIESWSLPRASVEVLTRIAGNLVDNALEAAASARDDARVLVRVRCEGGVWEMAVHNNGSHIEPELLNKVFEAGFSTKGSGEGRGLGLAVVRRLLDGSGGAVEVDSAPEDGTTFTVRFPV